MNAHVCDQEGCSIILDYGPTCGGFFMNWGQICMVKSFKKLSWTKIFQGMNCKELFIFRSLLPPKYAICFKKSLKIYPSWHALPS
jgi:hypothetical protein